MPDIDTSRLLWIVTGVQLNAELGDRPLAYRIEAEAKRLLKSLLPPVTPASPLPALSPVVISDVYFLNNEEIQSRPVISVGGPGVNAVSNLYVNEVPSAIAVEDVLIVQMDVEMKDVRCAVWGMDHLQTVQAVDLFISKYLDPYLRGVLAWLEENDD